MRLRCFFVSEQRKTNMFDVIGNTVNVFTKMHLGPWQDLGDTLLAGEGNMSFAKSLLLKPATQITRMIVTIFEKERSLTNEAVNNTNTLKRCGTFVMFGIDATRLEDNFKPDEFDTIIFQFPNVGSRDAKYGHNPNHVLIRKFLRSAVACLKPSGKIMVTAVDSPHYQGVFQFEEAAEFAGCEILETYPFDLSMFPGYSHTNTNDDESALDDYDRFKTWVFGLKR